MEAPQYRLPDGWLTHFEEIPLYTAKNTIIVEAGLEPAAAILSHRVPRRIMTCVGFPLVGTPWPPREEQVAAAQGRMSAREAPSAFTVMRERKNSALIIRALFFIETISSLARANEGRQCFIPLPPRRGRG